MVPRRRPTGEMNQPNPNLDHAEHDVTLIAGHAAGDLVAADRSRAEALLATCAACADLRRDLLAITVATRLLPAPVAPARDFRLTPAQAERLRKGSWLGRVLRPFAATQSAARPMAAAFTSLGVAGLLVAAALPGLFGSAAGLAPERAATTGAGGGTGAPNATTAPAIGPGAPVPQAGGATPEIGDYSLATNAPTSHADSSAGTKAGGETSGPGAVATSSAAPTTPGDVAIAGKDTGSVNDAESPPRDLAQASPPNLLMVGSLGLLVVGLLLFGLRFAGRRLRL
jgi:hypothetical protein